MAYDVDDVARSLRRYLALALDGPPWRIRTERRMVRDDDRPVAVLDLGPQLVQFAREARHQGNWVWVAPVTITCYPEVNQDEEEGAWEARTLRARLLRLVTIGVPVLDNTGAPLSGPFRVPLYDYADTPLTGADRAGPTYPEDVIWVVRESLTSEAIQDPDDPKRWTVVLEFRASVEAPGAEPTPEALVAGVHGLPFGASDDTSS